MNTFPYLHASAVTLPLTEARYLPPGHCPRVVCRAYWPVPKTLPNGLVRTAPLVADALLLIGGSFLVTARVLRSGPGQPANLFQIDQVAWDTTTDRQVLMPPFAPSIIRAAYDLLASQQVLVDARQNARRRRN